MKKYLALFLLIYFSITSYASPLVFKATKQVEGGETTELVTLNTAKYQKIRIAIDGEYSRNNEYYNIYIYAVEDKEEIFLQSVRETYVQFRTVIDVPPTNIRIKVKGKGAYKVYVWAN